ncbi:hypothetical protein CHS0354_004620 [Potamilus streckersoni]|uniref:Uncharacterized protein n=1 Tax=Potamilus streckersoni TaxID=2493646 RepID=A0AAE0S4W6_9BIVA|nr:hypothetical protein CHS0354_004620 [Potamilus streckersoni]
MVHVNIGGGRDNIVRYNIFYNATAYAMQVDSRGKGHTFDRDLLPRLKRNVSGNQIHHNVVYLGNDKEVMYDYDRSLNNVSWYNVSSMWIDNFLHLTQGHPLRSPRKVTDKSYFNDPSNGDFGVRCSAADWANTENFPQPLSRNEIGPRFATGPVYKHHSQTVKPTSSSSDHNNPPCATQAPRSAPQHSFLPDGSFPNTLYNVSHEGCWLILDSCHNHPSLKGTVRDTYGETHNRAGQDESQCLTRASKQWKECGSIPNHPVIVVYGPTGLILFTEK